LERLGVPLVPAPAFFRDLLCLNMGVQVQDQEKVTVNAGLLRLELDSGANGGGRFINPALISADVAEITVRLGIVRLEAQGPFIAGRGLVKFPQVAQGNPQMDVRLGMVRSQAQGLLKAGRSLRMISLSLVNNS